MVLSSVLIMVLLSGVMVVDWNGLIGCSWRGVLSMLLWQAKTLLECCRRVAEIVADLSSLGLSRN